MPVRVSPGVYTQELDLSLYIPQISTTIFGIVGEFEKGKVNEPVMVTSVLDFVQKFGNPNPNKLATYSALQYLRYGHQLLVVRVVGENSTKARTKVNTIHLANTTGTQVGPFTFTTTNKVFEIAIPQKNGTSQTFTFEEKTYTADEVAYFLNLTAYKFKASVDNGKIKLTATTNTNLKIGTGTANVVLGFTDNSEVVPVSDTVDISAFSEGDWANGMKLKITAGSMEETFKITINSVLGNTLEVWDYLSYDKSSERYFTKLIQSNYIEDPVLDDDERFVEGATEYILLGGEEKTSNTANYVAGLQKLRYPENVDVNLVAVPGKYDHEIITEMLSICDARGDCMAIIDPPFGFSVQEVIDWHNGKKLPNNSGVSYDSSYGAVYWPWIEVYDYTNKQKVWTPPSGLVASMYAYTDLNYELWFAPAGMVRGKLLPALRLEYNANQGDRDFLYGTGNAINPIISLPKSGVTIYGQRTLQRAPTALDRVNVRRLLLYLRKVIATSAQQLVFEPNDTYTRRRFISLVTPFLDGVQARRGLQEYKVVCDETNNTPDIVDRNEMVAHIYLKPTKVAEIIQVTFVLTSQGAKFDELLL